MNFFVKTLALFALLASMLPAYAAVDGYDLTSCAIAAADEKKDGEKKPGEEEPDCE
jgi:hypothetical protein